MNANGTVINELIRSAIAAGDLLPNDCVRANANRSIESPLVFKAVWATDIVDKWLFIGTESGRLEVWDAVAGELIYSHESTNAAGTGISALRANNSRAVVAYMNGVLEFYSVQRNGEQSQYFSTWRNHIVVCSAIDLGLSLTLIQAVRAHQQPVSALTLDSGHAVTGSLDHQLKVYKADTCAVIYTLRGHHGAITVLETDPVRNRILV